MAPFNIAKIDQTVENYGRNYSQAYKVLKKEDKRNPSNFLKIACADVLSRNGQFAEAEEIVTKLLEIRPVTHDPEYLRRLYNLSALIKKRQGLAYFGSTAVLLEYFRAAEVLYNKSSSKIRLHRPFEILFQSAYVQSAWKDLVAACREIKKIRNDIDIQVLSIALCSKASLYCKAETFYAAATSRGATNEANKIVENTVAGKNGPAATNIEHIMTLLSLWRSHDMKDKTREFFEMAKGQTLLAVMGSDVGWFHDIMQEDLHRFGEWRALCDLSIERVHTPVLFKMTNPTIDLGPITGSSKLWASWFVSARQLAQEGDEKPMNDLDAQLKTLEGCYPAEQVPCEPHLTRIKIERFKAPESVAMLCAKHFDMYGDGMKIIEDLYPILSPADRLPFIEKVKEEASAQGTEYMKRVVALCLEFRFIIEPARPSPELMEEFILRCLTLGHAGHNGLAKKKARYDQGTREVFFLAAMSILMLQDGKLQDGKLHVRRIQAAYLLAWVIASGPGSSSHAGAKILLLKTLISLGLGNAAFGYWPAVKAKKILQDAFSHNILARAATQIPFGVPDSTTSRDPATYRKTIEDELRVQLAFFERDDRNFITARGRSLKPWSSVAERSMAEQTTPRKDREHSTYPIILQRLDMNFSLDNSYTRALLRLELHRTLRIKGVRSTENEHTLGSFSLLVDNRDTTSVSDLKYPETSEKNVDILGNRFPGRAYLANFLLVEHTQSLIHGDRPLVADCAEVEEAVRNGGENIKDEAYEAELQALEVWTLVRRVVLKTLSSEDAAGLKDSWELLLTAVAANTPANQDDDRFFGKPLMRRLDAHALNTVFLIVELLLSLRKLCARLRDIVKDPKHKVSHQLKVDNIKDLSSSVEAAIGNVGHFARVWKRDSNVQALTESYRQCLRDKEDAIGEKIIWATRSDEVLEINQLVRLSDRYDVDQLARIFARSASASVNGILAALGMV